MKESCYVAFFRGINVGRAKRIAMADLRVLVEGLGHTGVRTVLNSGNVVFTRPASAKGDPAARIEKAIESKLGVSCAVIALDAAYPDTAMAGVTVAVISTPATVLRPMRPRRRTKLPGAK